jgi:hypothetical protein
MLWWVPSVPPVKAAEFKKMLKPVLDFEKRSATENTSRSSRRPSSRDS